MGGLGARLSRSGSPRWLIARRWSAYTGYLRHLEARMESVELPGRGHVRLEDSFASMRLRAWQAEDSKGLSPSLTRVDAGILLVDALSTSERLVLSGPAGSGKSALLRWHAIHMVKEILELGRKLLIQGDMPHLPLFLALKDTASSDDILEQAIKTLIEAGLSDASTVLEGHLGEGRACLLLDDLDLLDDEGIRSCAAAIADLDQRYPGNQIVLASRDPADIPSFRRFRNVRSRGG